ncbi:TPA: hypothetical protein EYN98_29725 [Candidatus Poribacteria bacterium]|nr:hypothetical protein [Candidatus Poribacteria bacterium]HIA70152.1 hypothetical protein [Candidatus Poribacteria bacterium]HIB89487.1 hypothetical protein [Candidatus Poribacteria bacterium]HIC01757.1 hypothetical protein [Candidatus Poribacteria bacterium]HIC19015.1 hypothetical protein [Candidatus Poribacteria bacterium]
MANDPPFLLIHGEIDEVVLISQLERFTEALGQAGVNIKFLRIPKAGHGPDILETQSQGTNYISEMVKCLN